MNPYTPSDNERDPPVQTRTDMNPNALPPTAADFPPMPDDQTHAALAAMEQLGGTQDTVYRDPTWRAVKPAGSDTYAETPGFTDEQMKTVRSGRFTLQPFESPTAPYYSDASTLELNDIRQNLCDDWARHWAPDDKHAGVKALWNEIERLRIENAAYLQRHADQERAIVTARAERDTARAAMPDLNMQDRDSKWKTAHDALSVRTLELQSHLNDSLTAITLITEQRNAARAELQARANEGMEIAKLRGDLDTATRLLQGANDALEEKDAEIDKWRAEAKANAWEAGVARAGNDTSTHVLHDVYTAAALPAIITSQNAWAIHLNEMAGLPDAELHERIVREARAIATEAVKQAREAGE